MRYQELARQLMNGEITLDQFLAEVRTLGESFPQIEDDIAKYLVTVQGQSEIDAFNIAQNTIANLSSDPYEDRNRDYWAGLLTDREFAVEANKLGAGRDQIVASMQDKYDYMDTPFSQSEIDQIMQGLVEPSGTTGGITGGITGGQNIGMTDPGGVMIRDWTPEEKRLLSEQQEGQQFSRFLQSQFGSGAISGPLQRGTERMFAPVRGGTDWEPSFLPLFEAGGTPGQTGDFYNFLQRRGLQPFTREELGGQLREMISARAAAREDPAWMDVMQERQKQATAAGQYDPEATRALLLAKVANEPEADLGLFTRLLQATAPRSLYGAAGRAGQSLWSRQQSVDPSTSFLDYAASKGFF